MNPDHIFPAVTGRLIIAVEKLLAESTIPHDHPFRKEVAEVFKYNGFVEDAKYSFAVSKAELEIAEDNIKQQRASGERPQDISVGFGIEDHRKPGEAFRGAVPEDLRNRDDDFKSNK